MIRVITDSNEAAYGVLLAQPAIMTVSYPITPELIEKVLMDTTENDPPQQEAIWAGLNKEGY